MFDGRVNGLLDCIHYEEMTHLTDFVEVDSNINRHFKRIHRRVFFGRKNQSAYTVLAVNHVECASSLGVNRYGIGRLVKWKQLVGSEKDRCRKEGLFLFVPVEKILRKLRKPTPKPESSVSIRKKSGPSNPQLANW